MITVTIDGQQIQVEPGTLVYEAAKTLDINIPVFCYHPKMKPVAACRMCLVSIEKMGKLQPACATPVSEGMVVHTQSEPVKKAQAGVLEFLLANHPLDCPICDKGGECPLQDQAFAYGPGATRFSEEKRHLHKQWSLGPLVVLDQERCVQCQRCTRFMEEIVGDPVLVLKERGAETVVDVAEGRTFDNVFSGNTIEMCPVGALTSHPYRFRARPWDIVEVDSVCPHCPVGCNLTVTNRSGQIMRVLSRENPEVDDGWLCDRGRFGYGFLTADTRLQAPLVKVDGELRPATWPEAIDAIHKGMTGKTGAIGGGRMSTEALLLFKNYMMDHLGSPNLDWRTGGEVTSIPPAGAGKIQDADDADAFIFLESEPLKEVPVLGLRIRKNVVHGKKAQVFAMGPRVATDLPAEKILYAPGEGAAVLDAALEGNGPSSALAKVLGSEEKIVIVWNGKDSSLVQALETLVKERGGQTKILVSGGYANSQGAHRIGFMPQKGGLSAVEMLEAAASGKLDALLVLAADPLREAPDGEVAERALDALSFLAVCDYSLTPTAEKADVVLPLAAFAESEGTFVNMEGRAQTYQASAAIPGDCREDFHVASLLMKEEADLILIRNLVEEALKETPAAPRIQARKTGNLVLTPSLYYRGVTPEPNLASLVPTPIFEMAPETAAKNGLKDGDEVQAEGRGGSLQGTVRVSEGVVQGYLFLPEQDGANRLTGEIRIRAAERRI